MIARYSTPRMRALWSDETRLRVWIAVEITAAAAMERAGDVPPGTAAACARGISWPAPDLAQAWRLDDLLALPLPFGPDAVAARERETRHDVLAFLNLLEAASGPSGRWLHRGLTSSDLLDTGTAFLLARAGGFLTEGLDGLAQALADEAERHKNVLTMGRSHGVHAEPTSFGRKLAGFYAETVRSRERVARAGQRSAHGKIAGSVGNHAHVSAEVEESTLAAFGLAPEPCATQVVPRDRHAEMVLAIALAGSGLDRLATEIRLLQRTETGEAREPFAPGQKGSSSMPHKKNPVRMEQTTGIARLLRSYAAPALEDVVLWHERDISHSSVERVILPDATTLLDYAVTGMTEAVRGLVVDAERMRKNVDADGGVFFSQRLLTALVDKGLGRDEAYEVVQRLAFRATEERQDFAEVARAEKVVRERLSEGDLARVFDLNAYLRGTEVAWRRLGWAEAPEPAAAAPAAGKRSR